MFNWNTQQILIQSHDNYYQNTEDTYLLATTFDLFADPSCTICYTPPGIEFCSDQFIFFWDWFSLNFSAYSFSLQTTELFDQFIYSYYLSDRKTYLDQLLETI